MIKCPFCYTKNDPAVRFCVLCKSDISNAEPGSESIFDVELVIDEPQMTEKAVPKGDLPLLEPSVAQQNPSSSDNPIPISSTHKPDSRPKKIEYKMIVLRGQQKEIEYRLVPGNNLIGRTDSKPVDIDLDKQEDPKKIWVSRQHAVIHVGENVSIEDLNSSNGTYVNRERIFPGQKTTLKPGDMIQIGSVLLKLQ